MKKGYLELFRFVLVFIQHISTAIGRYHANNQQLIPFKRLNVFMLMKQVSNTPGILYVCLKSGLANLSTNSVRPPMWMLVTINKL
ncbi:hypothetical protein SAMN06269250_6331 [Spirosoma fluviale]|uniref:Uncharacterized protein n=1 Tax=Spirosoma fluviale TaxID=1597977 RepID=A0A286GUT4_9BACT|nr:hypothetical protein SAMN06269250_6331 [Spirosoma fluviale]